MNFKFENNPRLLRIYHDIYILYVNIFLYMAGIPWYPASIMIGRKSHYLRNQSKKKKGGRPPNMVLLS